MIIKLIVSRRPAQNIIDDEHCDCDFVNYVKQCRSLFKSKRDKTGNNAEQYGRIICGAGTVIFLCHFYYFINSFSHLIVFVTSGFNDT